ncbi:MAG: hypothetical protein DYG94_09520 [Leptolyngbya sp. PLA3]|nr:MAG: hypothetical protein EDM82_11810 [Cyanobacteria bacterium CYA]MCE7968967.1 hypothetical protein [Leptolyngbya sp. PL-A3]
MTATPLTRPAHAKVNLALSVGPPHPPGHPHAGFHPICSWISAIALADQVRITRTHTTSIERRWGDGTPVEWPLEKDLVFRAHRLLESHSNRPLPVRIEIEKHIPAGGGLGGGSSDAAATLLALVELFDLAIGLPALRALGCSLGSDVGFFIDHQAPPRPGIVSGVGEQVERTERRTDPLVLICPPFGCATPQVYRRFDSLPSPGLDQARVGRLVEQHDPVALFNDLAFAAEAVEPRLGDLRRRVREHIGIEPHLSGSGSTLFLPGDEQVARRLQRLLPDTKVLCTRLV